MFLNSTKRKTPMSSKVKNIFAPHREALRPKLSKMQKAILKSSECSSLKIFSHRQQPLTRDSLKRIRVVGVTAVKFQ